MSEYDREKFGTIADICESRAITASQFGAIVKAHGLIPTKLANEEGRRGRNIGIYDVAEFDAAHQLWTVDQAKKYWLTYDANIYSTMVEIVKFFPFETDQVQVSAFLRLFNVMPVAKFRPAGQVGKGSGLYERAVVANLIEVVQQHRIQSND